MEQVGKIVLIIAVVLLFLTTFIPMMIRIVRQSTVGVIERLGKYSRTAMPGPAFMLPLIETMHILDMKEQMLAVRLQPVTTFDKKDLKIDTFIFYQVSDPYKITYTVKNLESYLEQIALGNARHLIENLTVNDVYNERYEINNRLTELLNEHSERWGVKVNTVEMKYIIVI